MRVLELPRRRYSMPETVMRKYRLRQRINTSSESSSSSRRRHAIDKSSQTSPRESIGRTGSYPSLATPSPRPWSCQTSDYQTVSDKTISTQDSTLSISSSYSGSPYRREDVQTQASLPERTDRTTSITGLEYAQQQISDVGLSVETDISEDTVIDAVKYKEESTQVNCDIQNSKACQADKAEPSLKSPEIALMNDRPDAQKSFKCVQVKEESSQVYRSDIIVEMDSIGLNIRRIPTDIACTGGNYEDYPTEKPVVPRYSAVPRTNSMLVNTSSVEYYSSDSDLSLTDSLEDPDEYRTVSYKRKHTRHDDRLVRGEVSIEQEKRRLPKSKDAYAYFLTLAGEEDAIREYSIPEWLRERLKKREEEIKKAYEDKLNRHQQCGYFRRRKKNTKRAKQRDSYSSGEVTKRIGVSVPDNRPKNEKTVRFDDYGANNINNNNNLNPSTSEKCSIRLLNGNNMGLEPKIDNIYRDKNNYSNHTHNNQNNVNNDSVSNPTTYTNGQNTSQLLIQTRAENNTNLVRISEVIKIEMSENKSTIITKEKQINLSPEASIQQSSSEIMKNELINTSKSEITKDDNSQLSAKLEDTNTINSFRHVNQCPPEINNLIPPTKNAVLSNQKEDTNRVAKDDHDVNNKLTYAASTQKEDIEVEMEQKIELDRKVADILISALEENTKAHHLCKAADPSVEKSEVKDETLQKYQSTAVQTENAEDYNNAEINTNVNKSCNTEPYLVSIHIQTSDDDKSSVDDDSSEKLYFYSENEDRDDSCNQIDDGISSFDTHVDESIKLVDKACNTVESVSISTQTIESILQSEDIVNTFRKEKTPKKRDVQFPPQVIKQIITGTGEYKTIEVPDSRSHDSIKSKTSGARKGKTSKGTNTEECESVLENNKNFINSNNDTNRIGHTPFCKNVFSNKTQQKKSQILELNVPPCSCHMCTLQKISPRAESKSKISQQRKTIDLSQDVKKALKLGSRRSNTKFKVFEAIPEERSVYSDPVSRETYTDSFTELKDYYEDSDEKTTCQNNSVETAKQGKEEKAVLTEPHLIDQVVQVGSTIANVGTNTEPETIEVNEEELDQNDTQLIEIPSKQTGETQTDSTHAISTQTSSTTQRKSNLVIGRFRSENQNSPMLYRQYKGRASLSAGQVEGQEELLTLSKGWINFYLLKDNFDLSDSNTEEPSTGRRRVKIEEDKVEEYTIEIHATPEPPRPLLPNLKRNGAEGRGIALPDIHTSSSSSTPDKGEKTTTVESLPGVRKSKKTRRINMRREAVKEVERPLRRNRSSAPPTTRSVEVARSEQSISSITSSTLILSESPPPTQLKLPEKRVHHRHRAARPATQHLVNGSSWTVTVAGSSGSGNDPPPDVEMKLSFANHTKKQEECSYPYHVARPKRQGRMIEEFSHITRNEKHSSVQCVQDLSLQAHQPKSCQERTRGGHAKDNFCYEEEYINRLSSRSRYSTEDGSEATGDLQVTGLAITPEKKPRVPTQSERDILRPQRYKFTR